MSQTKQRSSASSQNESLARLNEAFVLALGEITYDHNYISGEMKWSGAYHQMLGFTQEEMGRSGEDWIKRIHPDDIAETLSSFERARERVRHYDATYRVQRADGKYVWVNDVAVLEFAEDGSVTRLSGIIRDISARKREEERFRQVVQSAPDAMIIVGKKGEIELLNTQAQEMFGYPSDELMGRPIEILMPQRYRNDHLKHRDNYFGKPSVRPMGESLELFGRRKDGTEFPLEISLSPIETPEGTVVAAGIRDVTLRKEATEKQKMLMAELDHRVKNILNVVLSIAQQMLRRAESLETFKEGFLGRLMALAEVHRLLTLEKWDGVSIEKLAELATKPHVAEVGPIASIDGKHVSLPPKYAQAVYLALHELATNASKYGALSVPSGELELAWQVNNNGEGDLLTINWHEKNGPKVETPTKKGFGSRLLERTISYELSGQTNLEFAPTGLKCSIVIPLPSVISAAPLAVGHVDE